MKTLINYPLIKRQNSSFILAAAVLVLIACQSNTPNQQQDTELETSWPTGIETDTALDTENLSGSDTASDPDDNTDNIGTEAQTSIESDTHTPGTPTLVFNEIMSKNDGAILDEYLETDDWIELHNISDETLNLSDFSLIDGTGTQHTLPVVAISPGESVLFFADDQIDQGIWHLPFRISAEFGETLILRDNTGRETVIDVPPLAPNESYARFPDGDGDFAICRYPTPGRGNGSDCIPPPPPSMEQVTFDAYEWPDGFPKGASSLVINEIALRTGAFVEIYNGTDNSISLDTLSLRVSAISPADPMPDVTEGLPIPLPQGELSSNGYLSVPVPDDVLALLSTSLEFEGVITLFDAESEDSIDRIPFMSWPENAVLARMPSATGSFRFCTNTTPESANTCDVLAKRPVGDRLRGLRTPGDFDALSAGGTRLGIGSVKFIVDMYADNAVHLLGNERWDLHYTFVREYIDLEPHLNRCDQEENIEFRIGWGRFSDENYYQVEGRRYLLGTFSIHGGTGLKAVEYTFGDEISPEQMRAGYFYAVAQAFSPDEWVLRPQDANQVEKARDIEGTLPIAGPNAPFEGMDYQPLTESIGYGYLTFISTAELATAPLGFDVIVVTDDVPNDIALTAGLITEVFQTPLAHVNLLSRNRDTPNMALKNARTDTRIAPFLDKLVRLEVGPTKFEISEADPAEAEAFWLSRMSDGETMSAEVDDTITGIVDAESGGCWESRSAIGAKAAQLLELSRVGSMHNYCESAIPIPTPQNAFAIPVSYYLAHLEASGADQVIDDYLNDSLFFDDPAVRTTGLAAVRALIMDYPLGDAFFDFLMDTISERFGNNRVRFRSSSNVEDLPTFNGAGLYTSMSGELENPERPIDDAVKTVWASLWLDRAFDERTYARVDQTSVAMGILVHEAFLSEEANGVAVSRDILEPTRGDRHYINVQAGEATVTNPAPGVTSEQIVYQWPSRIPTLFYKSRSSLLEDEFVLWNTPTDPQEIYRTGEVQGEVRELVCALWSINDHFKSLLDPDDENDWFAMEVEFKRQHGNRNLVIKQARPYSFGGMEIPMDCRSN